MQEMSDDNGREAGLNRRVVFSPRSPRISFLVPLHSSSITFSLFGTLFRRGPRRELSLVHVSLVGTGDSSISFTRTDGLGWTFRARFFFETVLRYGGTQGISTFMIFRLMHS